jgi:hypothetical protein
MSTPDYTKMSLDELHDELRKLHDLFLKTLFEDRVQYLPFISEKIGDVLNAIDTKLTDGIRSAKTPSGPLV